MIKRIIRKIKEAKLRKKIMNTTVMYNNTGDSKYLEENNRLLHELVLMD